MKLITNDLKVEAPYELLDFVNNNQLTCKYKSDKTINTKLPIIYIINSFIRSDEMTLISSNPSRLRFIKNTHPEQLFVHPNGSCQSMKKTANLKEILKSSILLAE